jgi:hypothetical protein
LLRCRLNKGDRVNIFLISTTRLRFAAVAVIRSSESTVKMADLPLNVTLVPCVNAVPTIETEVPTGPLGGVNEVRVGVTLNV